jgi:hypothetical protein
MQVHSYFAQLLESDLGPYTFSRLQLESCLNPSDPRKIHLKLFPLYNEVLRIRGRLGQGTSATWEECLLRILEGAGLVAVQTEPPGVLGSTDKEPLTAQ